MLCNNACGGIGFLRSLGSIFGFIFLNGDLAAKHTVFSVRVVAYLWSKFNI